MIAREASDIAHQPRSQGLQMKNQRRNMAEPETYLTAAEGNKRRPDVDRIFAFLLETPCYSQN